jgi:hypothetical protein
MSATMNSIARAVLQVVASANEVGVCMQMEPNAAEAAVDSIYR